MPTETIYLPLVGEVTDVWAPVEAERVGRTSARILGSMPEGEQWAFAPGEIMELEPKRFADGATRLVAVARST